MTTVLQQLEQEVSELVGEPVEFGLTDDWRHGDLTSAFAFRLARTKNQPLPLLAQEVADRLNTNSRWTDVITFQVIGGFLNGTLTTAYLQKQSVTLTSQLQASGPVSDQLAKKRLIIEYSQPNIAKPMHFGHLRTTILGESLKRIFSALGATTIGINHLGDWGSQFGKLLAAYKRWGSHEELVRGGIDEMLRLYVKFHHELESDATLAQKGAEEFAKLEAGDPENQTLWRHMREVSLTDFRRFYTRLGITMAEPELGESTYVPDLPGLLLDAQRRGIAIESEGALIIPIGDDLPPCLIRKSDGATLYATRDLAAIAYRVGRWQPTEIIYVVAADQSLHFTQVFRAAARLGLAPKTTLRHVPYGLVVLPEGKMSTRAGRVIFLDDVLDEAVRRAAALIEEKSTGLTKAEREAIAEEVGIGAVKYQVLHQNRTTTIVFDWEAMLTLQGNTGPYLQYTHARTRSLLRKAGQRPEELDLQGAGVNELQLVRQALRLVPVLTLAARDYAPNHLTDWLYRLASDFNRFYEAEPILQAEQSAKKRRLALTNLVGSILAYGLTLLSLPTPDRI